MLDQEELPHKDQTLMVLKEEQVLIQRLDPLQVQECLEQAKFQRNHKTEKPQLQAEDSLILYR